ncbi:MAG: energy-coupling factor transporter ATPase [Clostridia bacterium]|nr:energy-coupling factor transporter ATPase [Clostridia bacterium]
MEAIKFEKVHFSYRNGEEGSENEDVFGFDSAFALDGIDFSVQEGEFVAVLGHNGSGKSTLARLTNGLLSPKDGKITVLGMDAGAEENLFEIRKNVGIVFQNPDNQTVASIVEDDVAFGPENIGVDREEIGKRIDFALNAVGMREYRHATTTRLSGGQKQRIAIAGVLALKPRVMILDESTAMLDPRGRKEVMDVVLKLNKEENMTVLLITHFPEEALLADRAVVMNRGRIVMEGKPQDVLTREEELEKCSLTLPRPIAVCKALKVRGLEIKPSFDAETVAENIAEALKKAGAGTRSNEKMPVAKISKNETDDDGKIVAKDLSYTYNERSPFATHALKSVDLTIKTGEFFGIIGHTGSGKSTFVQHLNALIKLPTAEKKYKPKKRKKNEPAKPETILRVGGYDLGDKTTDFRALRKDVGMVFQYPEYQLFAETVFEDVAFGLKNFRSEMTEAEIASAVREAIETVGLDFEQVKNASPFELSGGQRRRVAIAGVIVTKPKILVLDEPAAGLDPLGKRDVMRLLHKLHADWCKTVIVVSHDMDEIAENCTGAAVFFDGKILACGTPKSLFSDRTIADSAGLDIPFTAKLVEKLKACGIEIDCDLTTADFLEKTAEGGRSDA